MNLIAKIAIGACVTLVAGYALSKTKKTVSVKPTISTSGIGAKVQFAEEVGEVTYRSIRRNVRYGTFTGELLHPSKIFTSAVKIEGRVDCEMGGRNRTITIFGEDQVEISEKALKQILWQFGIECHGYVPVRKNVYSMAV